MYAKKTIISPAAAQALEVYMLPDGSYQLSRTQVSEAINVKRLGRDFTEFLAGKSLEASLCKEYNFPEILTEGVGRPIKGTPIKVAILYWTYHACKGNIKAQSLVAACTEELIKRLADEAFEVVKTEEQYQVESSQSRQEFEIVLSVMQRLETKIDSMETELKLLRPAYEKLEKIESTLEDYPNLKEALDYLVSNAHKAKKTYPLAKWLEDNNLDFIPSNVRMSIGRLVSSWCKLIEFKSPKGQYSDAFDPVLRFAVNYKLTQESK